MNDEAMLQELLGIAGRLHIQVRYEDVRAAGGLCIVNGEPMIIVPRSKSTEERVELLASELARVDTNDLYIAPQVRELIEQRRNRLRIIPEGPPGSARGGGGASESS